MKGFYIDNDVLDTNVMTLTAIRKTKLSDFQQNTSFPKTDTINYIGTSNLIKADNIFKVDLLPQTLCWGITFLPVSYKDNLEVDRNDKYGLNILTTNKVPTDKVYVYEFSNDMETTGGIGIKLYNDVGNITFNLNTEHLPVVGYGNQWAIDNNKDNEQIVIVMPIFQMKGNAANNRVLNRGIFDENHPYCIEIPLMVSCTNGVYTHQGYSLGSDYESLFLKDVDIG